MTDALLDLIEVGGVQTEETYPYDAGQQACRFDQSQVAVKVTGCNNYLVKDEEKLKEVLANQGPITISISGNAIQTYNGGVMTKDTCDDQLDNQNHAVLIVGYGTDNEVDYWLIKNSWGAGWGLQGYVKVHQGDNTCGIVTSNPNCGPEVA